MTWEPWTIAYNERGRRPFWKRWFSRPEPTMPPPEDCVVIKWIEGGIILGGGQRIPEPGLFIAPPEWVERRAELRALGKLEGNDAALARLNEWLHKEGTP